MVIFEPLALLVCLLLLNHLFVTSKFRIRPFHSCNITRYHVVGKGYKWPLENSCKNGNVREARLYSIVYIQHYWFFAVRRTTRWQHWEYPHTLLKGFNPVPRRLNFWVLTKPLGCAQHGLACWPCCFCLIRCDFGAFVYKIGQIAAFFI